MFRVGNNFNIPEEYKYVTVIGTTKFNTNSIKSKKNKKIIILHLRIILIIIKIRFIS